jgi:membrane protein implicated in regulation of membrane protease activity
MAKKIAFPADEPRYTQTDAILSAVGATLLIVTEMLGAVFAFAWAIGRLLALGDTLTYGLMVVFAVPGLYVSFALAKRVLRVETKLREAPAQGA